MKKFLLILLIVILAAGAAILAWYFMSRNEGQSLGNFVVNTLPFGSGENVNIPVLPPVDIPGDGQSGSQTTFDPLSTPTADLFRLSNVPVAGFTTFARGGEGVIRYMERATGHINEIILPAGTTSAELRRARVTNTTLPKVYEAYFRADGTAVIARSLRNDSDAVENLSLTLIPPSAASTSTFSTTSPQTSSPGTEVFHGISSMALRGDISAIAAGSGNTLFYALKDASSIVSSTFNGTGSTTLLTSVFNQWRLAAMGNNLLVYTKASASAPGHAYTINSSTGALTKILGPLNGLVAVPNAAGNRIAYSYAEAGSIRFFSRNLTNNQILEITPSTIAEKCVWSSSNIDILFCGAPIDEIENGEPDNWYKGTSGFSDYIWMFDTGSDEATVISKPTEAVNVEIDVVEARLSPNENYLVFINKNDLSLWALRLEQ